MLSKDQAQVELKKLMMTKEYLKGHKPTVARVQALTRVAHADEEEPRATTPRASQNTTAEQAQRTQQDARAEAAAIIKKNAKSGPSGPRPNAQRFVELTASCNAQVDQPSIRGVWRRNEGASRGQDQRAGDRSAGEKKPTEREIRLEMLAIMRADGYEVGRGRSRSGRGAQGVLRLADGGQRREQAIKNLAEQQGGDDLSDESLGLEK